MMNQQHLNPKDNPRDLFNCKFIAPSSNKNLRACLRCSLVKTEQQFLANGCENCPGLQLQGSKSRIEEKTTILFSGVISIMNPDFSWVAKWLGLTSRFPGCYCIEKRGDNEEEGDYEEEELEVVGDDDEEAQYTGNMRDDENFDL